MINFETKTFTQNGKILIKDGKSVNDYVISSKSVTWSDIESLYHDYETSFPNQTTVSMFYAKPESELTLSELIYGTNRSIAQETLELTLIEGILNKSLLYPDESKWFWQSTKYKNLIVPRWLFTDECHKNIAYKPQTLHENMLFDKNLVVRRLRQTLNTASPTIIDMSFKDCFLLLKEELLSNNLYKFFSDDIIDKLLTDYISHIKNQKAKAKTGQYVAAVKQAKNGSCKIKAVSILLEKGTHLTTICNLPEWYKIYMDFINYKTLIFIKAFVPDAKPLQFNTNIADCTESYIRDNLDAITNHIIQN